MTEALSSLLSTLSVQLIRITVIQLSARSAKLETVLGGGIIFRVEEHETERYMTGSVTCLSLGELSWGIDTIEVRVRSIVLFVVLSLTAFSVCYACETITTQRHTISSVCAAHVFT